MQQLDLISASADVSLPFADLISVHADAHAPPPRSNLCIAALLTEALQILFQLPDELDAAPI